MRRRRGDLHHLHLPSTAAPVIVELKATGTVAVFQDLAVVLGIKTKMAAAAGVYPAYVTITVRDASGTLISESAGTAAPRSRRLSEGRELSESSEFTISMSIAIPQGMTVADVLAQTNTALADPATATAALGVTVSAINVLVGAPPMAPPPMPMLPPASDGIGPPPSCVVPQRRNRHSDWGHRWRGGCAPGNSPRTRHRAPPNPITFLTRRRHRRDSHWRARDPHSLAQVMLPVMTTKTKQPVEAL